HCLDLGGDDLIRGANERQGAPHAVVGELLEQIPELAGAVEDGRPASRRVERGPDVEPLLRDRHEADALASPEELGEAAHPGLVVHDEPVRPVAHVDGLNRTEEMVSELRMNSIRTYNQVSL